MNAPRLPPRCNNGCGSMGAYFDGWRCGLCGSQDVPTTNPRTALWFKQREQCRKCQRVIVSDFGPELRCSSSEDKPYCIDAREPGAKCGPDAEAFLPM